jgi:two-component system chemotaxis sensor kinase CheA
MRSKEEEYREMFLAEALDNFEEINRLLTRLEKQDAEMEIIHALFRITHTLKGNAAGMGYTGIAEMAHTLEDLFGEVREGKIKMTSEIFSAVFKGVDILGALIHAIKDKKDVKYKGIKAKLDVIIKRAKENDSSQENTITPHEVHIDSADLKAASETLEATGEEMTESSDMKMSFSDLVQVPVRKLDNLLNLVSELIIERDRILASHQRNAKSSNEFARLSRVSSDLQYAVMDVRLVQVGFLFNKFHRVVRDAAALEKKIVVLKLEGTETEIDRNVLHVISDSVIHLIRNAVGHGLETPEERISAGKSANGTVWLSAKNDTDSVLIEIRDDGRGLNYNKIREKAVQKNLLTQEDALRLSDEDLGMLIFEPGFSTADQVTSIAGRGVGMDVVKRTIDSIGGHISINNKPGEGLSIILSVPSSMAVKSCLLLETNEDVFAIPLSFTDSVISLYRSGLYKAAGGLVASHQGRNVPIVFLKEILSATPGDLFSCDSNNYKDIHPEEKLEIVIVNYNHRNVGIVVDRLLQQKEIIEKPLVKPVDQVKMVGGVTILGTGKVCLVLNIPYILNFIFNSSAQIKSQAQQVKLNRKNI